MPIQNIQTTQSGLIGVLPSIAYIQTTDTEAQVLAAGYLNQSVQSGLAAFTLPCMACVSTVASAGAQPVAGWYDVTYTPNSGVPQGGNWSLVSDVHAAPALFTATTSSATPGTERAITGQMIDTATVVTSGNLVGVRGEVDMVGASGGFFYGCQGKVIPTGTLSGSSWTAGLFGQLDWHAATINAGQVACVWADMGATSGTATNVTGLRMFAGTNTTAATANSMIYLYGKSTNLFELTGSSSTYISSGGSGAPSGTVSKIAITIDGVTNYIVASTVVS